MNALTLYIAIVFFFPVDGEMKSHALLEVIPDATVEMCYDAIDNQRFAVHPLDDNLGREGWKVAYAWCEFDNTGARE